MCLSGWKEKTAGFLRRLKFLAAICSFATDQRQKKTIFCWKIISIRIIMIKSLNHQICFQMTVQIDNSQVAKISNEIGWMKNKVEGVILTELAFCKTDFGNSA